MRSRKPKKWSPPEISRLVLLAREGANASKIASELARYPASVKRVAHKMGLLLENAHIRKGDARG